MVNLNLFYTGGMCGLGMDNTNDGLERQHIAVALSGVTDIERMLPGGFKADLGSNTKFKLNAGINIACILVCCNVWFIELF